MLVQRKNKLWSMYTAVLLCPTFIYPVESSPQLSQKFVANLNQLRFKEVTSEIIFSLQKYSLTGQIFTLDTELDYEGHLDSKHIQDAFIPTIVFGKRNYGYNSHRLTPINATVASTRHNFPNSVHIRAFQQPQHPTKRRPTGKKRRVRDRNSHFNPQWKRVYALTLGQSLFTALPDRLRFKDYFIHFGSQTISSAYDSGSGLDRGGGYRRDPRHIPSPQKTLSYTPNNVIHLKTELQYKSPQSRPRPLCQNRREDLHGINPQRVHSFRGNEEMQRSIDIKNNTSTLLSPAVPEPIQFLNCNLQDEDELEPEPPATVVISVYISCGPFCITEANINFLNFVTSGGADGDEPCRALKGSENSRLSPTACILQEVAVKLSTKDGGNAPVVFFPGIESEWTDLDHPNQFLHSGTVEIFKRDLDLRVASSPHFGRGGGSGMLYNSVVFLAKKRFYSWDNTLRPLSILGWLIIVIVCGAVAVVFALIKIVTMSNSDQPWYDYVVQQMLDIMHEDRSCKKSKLLAMRGGESTDVPASEENGPEPNAINNNNNSSTANKSVNGGSAVDERGKASKAMLHGTIRIVSFVMVAIYEGKLYNTITFPKARFVSTFDELLTSDKYAVKLSREVADVNFLLGSKNFTMLNRFSESFNIEDCINWVEHSVSHGCVAYDFEFRNLPKAHKMKVLNEDTIFARSKTSILNSMRRKPSPVTTALLHPAAHLSRWVLEAGIFQFWMVAENFFMENLVPSKMTKRKVFSIKDYVSLFFVYVSLLVLASFVFVSEVLTYWIRKRFVKKSLLGAFSYVWKTIKRFGVRLRGLWRSTRSFFTARQKYCIRMKRIINSIV